MTKSADTLKKGHGAGRKNADIENLNIQLAANIEQLLEFLDADFNNSCYKDIEGIRGPALCHGGDNPTGFTFYNNTGIWSCWTRGCNRIHGNDMIGLIRAVKDVSFGAAVEIAKSFLTDKKVSDKEIEQRKEQRKMIRLIKRETAWKDHNEQTIFSESCLRRLKFPEDWCKQRGFNMSLIKSHGIGIGCNSTMSGRVVCPVRNVRGKIVGFSGRLLNGGEPKWLHFGFKKNINLFNINGLFNLSVKDNVSTAIICEGPFDVIKLAMAGVSNAVAVFGDSVTEGQIEILRKTGISKLILAFDGDTAGIKATERTLRNLEKNLFDLGTIYIEDHVRRIHGDKWDYDKWGKPDWGHKNITVDDIKDIIQKEGLTI